MTDAAGPAPAYLWAYRTDVASTQLIPGSTEFPGVLITVWGRIQNEPPHPDEVPDTTGYLLLLPEHAAELAASIQQTVDSIPDDPAAPAGDTPPEA